MQKINQELDEKYGIDHGGKFEKKEFR